MILVCFYIPGLRHIAVLIWDKSLTADEIAAKVVSKAVEKYRRIYGINYTCKDMICTAISDGKNTIQAKDVL